MNDEKPPVVSKALQILKFLGLAEELEHTKRALSGRTSNLKNKASTRCGNATSVASHISKSTAAEADLLGFDSSPVAPRKAPLQNDLSAIMGQPDTSNRNISVRKL